jgi:hypothetical protein
LGNCPELGCAAAEGLFEAALGGVKVVLGIVDVGRIEPLRQIEDEAALDRAPPGKKTGGERGAKTGDRGDRFRGDVGRRFNTIRTKRRLASRSDSRKVSRR